MSCVPSWIETGDAEREAGYARVPLLVRVVPSFRRSSPTGSARPLDPPIIEPQRDPLAAVVAVSFDGSQALVEASRVHGADEIRHWAVFLSE